MGQYYIWYCADGRVGFTKLNTIWFPGHSVQWENSMKGRMVDLIGRLGRSINISDGSVLYMVLCGRARRRHIDKHARVPWAQLTVGELYGRSA